MKKILVIENDENLNRRMCCFLNDSFGLSAINYVDVTTDEAENNQELYEMIILDTTIERTASFAYMQKVTKGNEVPPILFISDRKRFENINKFFRLGTDDCMLKPVDLTELLFRVKAILRRTDNAVEGKIAAGNLVLDADSMSALVDGREIILTTREFGIIYKLLSNPQKAFSRSQIMEGLWKSDDMCGPRAIDIYITKLRNKLSVCKGIKIVTVRGIGYKAVIEREK